MATIKQYYLIRWTPGQSVLALRQAPDGMVQIRGYRVIAEFSVHPIGEGTTVSRYVRAALAELKKAEGLRLQVTPMGTVIEAEKLSDILPAVQRAHESLFRMGAERVDFLLRIDGRRHKTRHMQDKVRAVAEP